MERNAYEKNKMFEDYLDLCPECEEGRKITGQLK
jgi:hypothetical protein